MSDLFAALKAFRAEQASALGQPAYCVFTNAELDALVAACPQTAADLSRIKGFGAQKVRKFGDSIVEICSMGLSRPPQSAFVAASSAKAVEAARSAASASSATASSDLQSALKAFRTGQASALGQPAYCIFTNAELDALVAACPQTAADLSRIKGFGAQKVRKFGDGIVKICSMGLSRSRQQFDSGAAESSKRKLPDFAAASFSSSSSSSKARSTLHASCPPLPPMPSIERNALNEEQAAASRLALSGVNIFLTGAAGVGKSFLLRFIIQELEKLHSGQVAVTAPTGIAASHVQGVTIHSWAGIGLGKGSRDTLLQKVQGNGAACDRWRKARVLVIDEISMLDSFLLDVLDHIGRNVLGNLQIPFGGLQLILCGDFFQLPPVSLGGPYGNGFAFQSRAWQQARVQTIELKTIVRQQGDLKFIGLLTPIRVGQCTPEATAALAACHVDSKAPPRDGILPTKLYCKNANVDAENAAHLQALPGEARTFTAIDQFKGDAAGDVRTRLLELVEKKAVGQLNLKLGAQCLLTKNMPEFRLVNGSRGVVTAFEQLHVQNEYGVPAGDYECPVVSFDSGQKLTVKPASFFQGGPGGAVVRIALPLKLAWALTVHKSQGIVFRELSSCSPTPLTSARSTSHFLA